MVSFTAFSYDELVYFDESEIDSGFNDIRAYAFPEREDEDQFDKDELVRYKYIYRQYVNCILAHNVKGKKDLIVVKFVHQTLVQTIALIRS